MTTFTLPALAFRLSSRSRLLPAGGHRAVRRSLLLSAAASAWLCLPASAQAADLSGVLWKYIGGQATQQPVLNSAENGAVLKLWATPAGLAADGAMFVYLPKESTNHWAMFLVGPRAATPDYLGTRQAKLIDSSRDADGAINTYVVQGGRFKNMLVLDGNVRDSGKVTKIFVLLTPQMADVQSEDELRQLLRR